MAKFEFRKSKETATEVTEALRQEVSTGVAREALALSGIEGSSEKPTPVELRDMRKSYEQTADTIKEMRLWADRDSGGEKKDPFEQLGFHYAEAAHLIESLAKPASSTPNREQREKSREAILGLIEEHAENDAEGLNVYHVSYYNPETGKQESRRPGYDEETGRTYVESRREAQDAANKRMIVEGLQNIYTYKTETGML